VAALFPVDRSVVNFENGYFGMMGRPVAQAYHRHIDEINRRGSVFVRGQYDAGEAARVRDRVALELGAKPQEVALTRGPPRRCKTSSPTTGVCSRAMWPCMPIWTTTACSTP